MTHYLFTLWAGDLPFASITIKMHDGKSTETVAFSPSPVTTTITMATLQTPYEWHQLDLSFTRLGRKVIEGETIRFAAGHIILPTRIRRSGQTAWDRISHADEEPSV